MLFSDLASKTFTRFAITLLRCPSEVNKYSDSSYFLNRVGKTKKFICSHDLLRNHPRLQTIVIEVYTQINFRRKGLKMMLGIASKAERSSNTLTEIPIHSFYFFLPVSA